MRYTKRFTSPRQIVFLILTIIILVSLWQFRNAFSNIRFATAWPASYLYNQARISTSSSSMPINDPRLDSLTAKLTLLTTENNQLRNQLNFKFHSTSMSIGADVIGHDLDTSRQSFLINRGSADGVQAGRAAFTDDGVLVGKISKVFDNSAWLQLLTDSMSKVGAVVLNEKMSQGVVEGGFGISLRMRFLPRADQISVGQKVVTSGLESGIPRGLLIGTVALVENEAYQPFQEAIVTPYNDSNQLRLISILTNSASPN